MKTTPPRAPSDRATPDGSVSVTLRKHPYPYRTMLAICSDLDETPDGRVYREIVRFLNTHDSTAMGPGVGLEVGNSIFFMAPEGEFSYFGTDDAGREMVRALMRSGHVDCIHSYGALARNRSDAETVIAELVRHGCELKVWVDHSKAPSNFGPDIMCGHGDLPGSEVYHSDLTRSYGIRYVWRGRTTGVVGQDAPIEPRSLTAIFRFAHPLRSSRTIAKQIVKISLGSRSHPKWTMHAANRVCQPAHLRDGRPIWEFLRSNPHWGGSGCGATADGISDVLTDRILEHLVRRSAACVLYTHLGKVSDPKRPFGAETQHAFRQLAAMHHSGQILVTTTHRLLRYLTVRQSLRYEAFCSAGHATIVLQAIDDSVFGVRQPSMDDLSGVTFTLDRCDHASLRLLNGDPVEVSLAHEGQLTHVSVPWRPLRLPPI